MDVEAFRNQAARAQAARTRVVDLHANLGPVSRLLLTAAGLVLCVLVLLLLIPLFLLGIVAGIVALTALHVRRRLMALGRPNTRVAGVRTDGRENVRVITRD